MTSDDTMPFEFMARHEDWSAGVSISMRQRKASGGQYVARPVIMESLEPGAFVVPMMKLGIQEAQQLMDELWRCGLRPTEGTGSAGSLAATERHLADMQKIAFGLLNKSGV